MGKTKNGTRYPEELRARAVRMVLDHESEYASRSAAILSISQKVGYSRDSLRIWVKQHETDIVLMISDRPAEISDRAVPGHWEGDLILGLGSSAIGTLVERTTRFTMLLHLPRMKGHGTGKPVKNGPALAGHGAEAVRDAITETISSLPAQLRRSLTWDQGAEMAQHAQLRIDTGLEIYFCDPQSPWQRGSNENTNGLLRQYFPKGIDLSKHGADELSAVANALNTRLRKTLDWQTPAEALDRLLKKDMIEGVATIG
ncbi:IS30 family transposase [Aliiruegeria haliotis]|uniref:IS30 family transposase n=1 Tax=Aliiruegeria haliotis TaxID=1280846 RepID=A0A2T0RH51_9RHOB|nr:IS30 family transposase [Aliiruegeria haliotis]